MLNGLRHSQTSLFSNVLYVICVAFPVVSTQLYIAYIHQAYERCSETCVQDAAWSGAELRLG